MSSTSGIISLFLVLSQIVFNLMNHGGRGDGITDLQGRYSRLRFFYEPIKNDMTSAEVTMVVKDYY